MIDDYKETMELMDTMKNCLPISAYPSKELVSLLKQKNIKIKTNQRLKIINIHYFGDVGGIVCGLKFPFKTKENYVISLSHLRSISNHDLAKSIRRYQIHRIKNIAKQ